MPSSPLRVLIVAPDLLARTGLASVLGAAPEFDVVAQAAPSPDIHEALAVYQPQIVLWDTGWSAEQDRDLLAELVEPDGTLDAEDDASRVALVALAANEGAARLLWETGVRAVLLRSTPLPRLTAALAAAAEGLIVVDEPLLALFARVSPTDPLPLEEPLTERERQVLQLLAQGLANKAIARALTISEHTVKFHVNAILSKLGAQSRTDAVVRASRAGLVTL